MSQLKKVAGVLLIAGLVIGSFLLATIFTAKSPTLLPSGDYAPRFRVAAETTFITEPIDEEVYPDYEKWFNRKLSAGVDPEKNRIVAMLKSTGPKVFREELPPSRFFQLLGVPPPAEHGDELLSIQDFLSLDRTLDSEKYFDLWAAVREGCGDRPWKKETYPQIAAWIDRNQRALDAAILASQKPQYFHPLVGRNRGEGSGSILEADSLCGHLPDEVTSLLCCRAMLEIGQGNYLAAKQSFLSCLRFIRSFTPISLLEVEILAASEYRIYSILSSLLEKGMFSLQDLESLAREIEAARPVPALADIVNNFERIQTLESVLLMNRNGNLCNGLDTIFRLIEDKNTDNKWIFKKSFSKEVVDYDEILIGINKWFDQFVAVLRVSDPQTRREGLERTSKRLDDQTQSAMDRLRKEAESWLPGSFSASATSSLVGLEMSIVLSAVPSFQKSMDRTEQMRRLSLISLALAQHKIKTGRYPDKLSGLVSVSFKLVPTDVFTGNPPIYLRTPDGGYLLYSVGADGIDSRGRSSEDDSESDDIRVRIPAPTEK